MLVSIKSWGQTTYTFDSSTWGASPVDWTSGKAGLAYVSGRGIQISTGATGAYGNSPVSFSNISKVVVNYSTNASAGVGTINAFAVATTGAAAQSGTRIGTSQSVTTTGGTTNRAMTFTPSSALTGFLQIYVTCTTNSIYIYSVEVTYSAAATPTLTLTPTSLTGFTYAQGSGPSGVQSYNLKGTDLTAAVNITAPTNFEVSKTSGGTYAASISYTATEGNITAGQTVYTRLKSGLSAGSYGGSTTYITNASTNASTKNISVTGSVTAGGAYTLTYNGNDNTSDASTVPPNASFTGGQSTGIILASPTTLAKTGYALASWYSIPNGVTGGVINTPGANYGPAPMPNNDITLYARWRFTISYNNNTGAGTVSQTIGYYNGTAGTGTTTLNSGSTLTKTGYTFGGWKTVADGTAADYAPSAAYAHSGSSSAVTLYAHWVPVPNPVLSLAGTVSHGTICVGTAAITRFYTIQNTGADASGITVVSNNADFVVSNLSSTSILTNGTATFEVTFTPSAAGAGTAAITVASTTPDSNSPTINLTGTGTANSTPTVSIVSNPSNTTICAGTSVTFTATAPSVNFGGGTASYQWKLNGSNVGSNVTTYSNAELANGDIVTCVVSVSGGCVTSSTATSNTITMTVNPMPINPNGDIELNNPYCGSATLIYELSDPIQEGVTYYWQTVSGGTSTANPLVFAPEAGVAEPYTVTAGGLYYVRAFNGFCWSAGSYVTGSAVVIAVAVGIGTQPTNQSAAVGATAAFSVVASGTGPFTYQWQESPTGIAGSWVNVGTSATLSLTNVQLTKNGYKYHVIVSNGCNSKTSDIVTLSVNLTPVSIWSNDITATNPSATNPYTTGDVKDANITVSGITRGSGLVAVSATGRYAASGWNSAALDINDYFEFTLTPNSNYEIDFSSFKYTGQASGTGPASFALRSSIDNFATNIGSPTVGGTTISLAGTTYQNIKTAIKLRFYAWGASGAAGTFSVNDFDFTGNVSAACTPATITAFPTAGPVNTIVTITGSDFTAASTVKFGTVAAVVDYVNTNQIKAVVPIGANGNIIVDTSLACDSETAFTLINSDTTNCEVSSGGGSVNTPATDLIIYEVYDENGGTGGMISFYNGTTATVNLSDYNLYRASTYGSGYGNYAAMSGTVAPGALAVIGVGDSPCGYTASNGTITSGFNDNDGFQLRKNAGATIVDDVRAPNYSGYYMRRKNTDLAPNTTYNDAQWTTQNLDAAQCIPSDQIGQTPGVVIAPIVNTQPTYSLTCDVVNTSLSITATEGFTGGNPLAYQWYVLGATGTWTAISNTGVYTGANAQTLNISDVAGLNNNQYYCQVRENTQTCFTATNAAQIKEASNTWASNIWSNGSPVLGSKVIIAGNYNTQINGILDVCNLTVNAVGSVRVKPNYPITVKKKITNLGSAANFVVENDANLIQIDNVTNEGNTTVERQVTDMNNVTGQIDYVYWSSPVSGQVIKGAAGFSPNTPSTGYLQYNETNDLFSVTNDATFLTGKGYAIRAETGINGYTKTYTFAGIANNGDLQFQNLKWTNATHGFNLVGNPYPSNIDFDKLFSGNQTKIYSTVWFWTNNSYTSAQVGSGYNGNNYAVYNGTGGSPATYNPTNPYDGSIIPDGKIKVGQAFIIQVKQTGKDLALDFNNNMRVTDNGNFYQKTTKNRFWLNMTSPSNLVNTILIGYIPGATNDYETDFDGELFAVGSDSFYSILGAKKLAIQGKSNEFSPEDVVALGTVFSVNGTYTIKLNAAEGIFDDGQSVYLRDKLLDKYIDLSAQNSYTFEASKGTNNTRFEIVYKDKMLNADEKNKSDFQVYRNGENFEVHSSQKLGNVEIYDTSGKLIRKIFSNEKDIVIEAGNLPTGMFIIRAENSGDIRTKKIIK